MFGYCAVMLMLELQASDCTVLRNKQDLTHGESKSFNMVHASQKKNRIISAHRAALLKAPRPHPRDAAPPILDCRGHDSLGRHYA